MKKSRMLVAIKAMSLALARFDALESESAENHGVFNDEQGALLDALNLLREPPEVEKVYIVVEDGRVDRAITNARDVEEVVVFDPENGEITNIDVNHNLATFDEYREREEDE